MSELPIKYKRMEFNAQLQNEVRTLEAELSATKEKLEVTEKAHGLMEKTCMQWKTRAEAAEKRIREAQEQEPAGYVLRVLRDGLDLELSQCVRGAINSGDRLYTIPQIPPELAELQRENAELRKQLESLNDLHH